MKKFIYTALLFALLLPVSCTEPTKRELRQERDNLLEINAMQADSLAYIKESFDLLTTSLDSINYQENILFVPDEEHPTGKYSKEEIATKLDSFQQLVDRQKKKISSLEESLRNSKSQIASLNRLVTHLKSTIEEKDQEIEKMRQELTIKTTTIRKLNTQVSEMNQTISQLEDDNQMQLEALKAQDAALNEAYVYMATSKEMNQKGITTLFKTDLSKVNIADAIKVDVREFNDIVIPSKNPKILSSMPASSYTLTKTGTVSHLTIHNPAEFWSHTNILVVKY